ncbi:MAG: DNA repair protein RecN [Anaerolineae bacterium]|nr:DNA repair protein RecN [Anaerolineae bacterium]
MLSEITIRDFAIISELVIRFDPGFNVLTGETGAGKSIIMDAVGLLLGAKADSSVVRAGAPMALVEGIYSIPEGAIRAKVSEILTREAIEGDSADEIVITREIRSGGRSVVRVNGHLSNQNVLQEIGELLIDIHGQGNHLSLLKPAAHLELLDRYGHLEGPRAQIAELAHRVDKVRAEQRHLQQNLQAIRQRTDMLSFKVNEITSAALESGEDTELDEEARRLANSEQIATHAAEAFAAVFNPIGGEGASANDLLAQAALALNRLAKIDPAAQDLASLAETLSVQAEELGRSLDHYQDRIEFDPDRLSLIELRLATINALKRKYGQGDIEGLLKVAEDAAAELALIDNSDERILQLQDEEATLLAEIGRQGAALSRLRAEAADRLAQAVEGELNDLRMEAARFSVAIDHDDDPLGAPVGDYRVRFDETGIDRVEFMLAANPGEPLRPMIRVASGGETARIMLALKTVLSRADETPVLIFDEIDTGIGARIGVMVGQKLWSLTANHQVIVVTHMAQLAGFGDRHFKVEKQINGSRTETFVYPLDEQPRIQELSAMLGPEAASSRQSAQEILRLVQQIKASAPSAG